jgi:hypothetical protein
MNFGRDGAGIRLQPEVQKVLKHLCRYRLTTAEILGGQVLVDVEVEALSVFLSRLCKDKSTKRSHRVRKALLQSHPLYGKKKYYQLSPHGASFLDLPDEWTKPLGVQALPRRYAIVLFCCTHADGGKLIFPDEFRKYFPELEALPGREYVLDSEQRLSRIKVDHGSEAGRLVRDLVQKTQQSIKLAPALSEFIRAKKFSYTVLTTTAPKAEQIREKVNASGLSIPVNVCIIDELINLVSVKK